MTRPKVELSGSYRRNLGVETRQLGDELLVVNERDDTIFNLNHFGAVIWQQLEDGANPQQIIALLTTAFPEIAPARLEKDVVEIIAKLLGEGLLRKA